MGMETTTTQPADPYHRSAEHLDGAIRAMRKLTKAMSRIEAEVVALRTDPTLRPTVPRPTKRTKFMAYAAADSVLRAFPEWDVPRPRNVADLRHVLRLAEQARLTAPRMAAR